MGEKNPVTNPFPDDPVVTDTIEGLPDYKESESYDLALRKGEEFRDNFLGPKGRALGIRGSFGSGKTHLIFQIVDFIASSSKVRTKHIYAKSDTSDFMDLYASYFVRCLETEDLRHVIARHLAKLLRAHASREMSAREADGSPRTLAEIAHDTVDNLIETDPALVLKLVEDELLPVTGLQAELGAELEPSARKTQRDFLRAYIQASNLKLGNLALSWIRGEKLSDTEAQDLGIESRQLDKTKNAKDAMRFLLAAYRQAECALIFTLDEFERFGLRGTPDDKKRCPGLLKDLAALLSKII